MYLSLGCVLIANVVPPYSILQMIQEKGWAPVIVFSFSRRECEANAMQMAKLDLNTPEEQETVEEVRGGDISFGDRWHTPMYEYSCV